MTMGRILVTGAGGRVGSVLIPKLVEAGYEVLALTSKPKTSGTHAVFYIEVDWNDLRLPLLPEVDCVIHLAHQTSAYQARKNVLLDNQCNLVATIRLLEHLKAQTSIPKFIFMGSLTEYGSIVKNPISEFSQLRPETFYDVAKITTEVYLQQYFNEGWITQLVTLRLGNLYGLGSQHSVAHRGFFDNSISRGAAGESIVCFGDGEFIRDFIHVEDVLDALLSVVSLPVDRRNIALNIAAGVGTSVRSALELINTVLVSQNRQPTKIEYVDFPPGAYEIEKRSHVADIHLAHSILSWVPRISLFEGVEKGLKENFVGEEIRG